METRDEFRSRLRKEGRIEDFVKKRKQLIESGLSKKEAWEIAASFFGLNQISDECSHKDRFNVGDFEDRKGSLSDTFLWVANNLAAIEKEEFSEYPPSRKAITILNWVQSDKKNISVFFTSLMPKMVPNAPPEPKKRKEASNEELQKAVDRIAELADQAVKEAEKQEREWTQAHFS